MEKQKDIKTNVRGGANFLNKWMPITRKTKKRAVKMFLLLLFIVLLVGISYGYVNKIINGSKQTKLTAGILDLDLYEGEEVTVENLYPQANEVGLIQEEAFDFKLINKTENPTNYILKLQRVETPDELNLTDVVYGLTKDNVSSTALLSELEEGDYVVDSGTIKGNQTINYELRFWLREDIEDDATSNAKTLKYTLNIEVNQTIARDPSLVQVKLFSEENLGENCKTYSDGIDTFLVGQCSQNYVWYSGKLWRVVLRNNATGAVKMVTSSPVTTISYNTSKNISFHSSYVDQWLSQEFLPTLHDYEDYLEVDSVWDATEDSSSTPSRPSYTTSVTRTVGLLNTYEYYTTYASSDGLATNSTGYLNNTGTGYWWLMTSASTSRLMSVGVNGALESFSLTLGNGIRPTVNLKSTIFISGGTGSIDKPYILEGDTQETINGITLLNTRYSGEYIIFNSELYRIVGVENGLTKITAVDKPVLLSSNAFHNIEDIQNFAEADIKTDLENYYQDMKTTNEAAYNMIQPSTTWYLGTVGSSTAYHYKASICATVDAKMSMNSCTSKTASITANIGLLRVGEMFTSQITRGKKANFWTLTPFSDTQASYIIYYGLNYSAKSTNLYGARPSMYLKQNVKIAGDNTGNGTYEKPYSIELEI